jgi:hypothetical protein
VIDLFTSAGPESFLTNNFQILRVKPGPTAVTLVP